MHAYAHGRHEHGQNFLTHRPTIHRIVDIVAETSGPILEIGPGHGALTLPMRKLDRPITAVEISTTTAQRLRARVGTRVDVVVDDVLTRSLPRQPHTIVGNLPFHLTTAILRKLLHNRHWSQAVLITQWEVARRRAGVGGSTMMTAQWAPFYQFGLAGRIPARAYTPAPSVDGGILTITRRDTALLPWAERRAYAGLVHRVFTGRGRGVAQILRSRFGLGKAEAGRLCGAASIRATALPKDLEPEQWARLWAATRQASRSPR